MLLQWNEPLYRHKIEILWDPSMRATTSAIYPQKYSGAIHSPKKKSHTQKK